MRTSRTTFRPSLEQLGDRITPATLTLAPTTLPIGVVGSTYDQLIVASGAAGPFTYSVTSGAAPTGLTLSSGGDLAGTPTATGTFNFTISASDGAGDSGSQAYSVTTYPALSLSPTTLPNDAIGTAYNQTMTAAGPPGPYNFTISAGTLPAGISLSTDGHLTGTPTATGKSTFTINVTDNFGDFAFRSYTVTITPTLVPVLASAADSLGNVVVFDPKTGTKFLQFRPFDTAASQYIGQMSVALGDVNGDGIADLIVATRGKRAGKIKVFDGAGIETGTVKLPTQTILVAFPVTGYQQGLTVAAADVNGDTIDDIAVATRTSTVNGSLIDATVVVYAGTNSGGGGGLTGSTLGSFQPVGTSTDGIYVAAGDTTSDGKAEIAVSSANRAQVKIFTRTAGVFTQLGTTIGDGSALVPGNGDGQLRALRVGGASTTDGITGALNPATGAVQLQLFSSAGALLDSYSIGTGATFFAIDAIDLNQNGQGEVMLARVTPAGGTTISLLNPTTGAVLGTLNSILNLTGKVTIAGT